MSDFWWNILSFNLGGWIIFAFYYIYDLIKSRQDADIGLYIFLSAVLFVISIIIYSIGYMVFS